MSQPTKWRPRNVTQEWRVAEAIYNRFNVVTNAHDAPQLRNLRPTILQAQWLSLAQAAIREINR